MATLKIGYALEGPADYPVIPILCERIIAEEWPELRVTRATRRARRRGHGYVKELPLLVKGLEDEGVDMLVAVVDTDNTRVNERLAVMREIAEQCQPTPLCFVLGVAVRSMEAWLLADEQAIARALDGTPVVARQPDPETITEPKQHLNAIIRELTADLESQVGAFARSIAQHIDLRRLQDRCHHFEMLAQELRNCVRQVFRS